MLISIAYSEIMIKGGNRRFFENLLVRNALSALGGGSGGAGKRFRVQKGGGRILLRPEGDEDAVDPAAAREALTRTFGVDSVTFPREAAADMHDIERTALLDAGWLAGKSIRVDTKRSDKSFPLTSPQVNAAVGKALVGAGCGVDLERPDVTVSIEILRGKALVFTERHKGPGGLPVGSSGKVLSLLSGGIDSPVSSWMMMRRGCSVDFLHIHSSPRNSDVMQSKMARILGVLRPYSPSPLRAHVAPYGEFYKRSMSLDPRIELVVFRRFLFHLANALAEKHGYKGVVSGDSVGQVASQTLDNIYASDSAARIPVFRPLAGMNKQEIIDLGMKIGTYVPSIEAYKDCCSLVAHKSPSTHVRLEDAEKAEKEIGMMGIVERTLSLTECVEA